MKERDIFKYLSWLCFGACVFFIAVDEVLVTALFAYLAGMLLSFGGTR